jgi:hypothetical protein
MRLSSAAGCRPPLPVPLDSPKKFDMYVLTSFVHSRFSPPKATARTSRIELCLRPARWTASIIFASHRLFHTPRPLFASFSHAPKTTFPISLGDRIHHRMSPDALTLFLWGEILIGGPESELITSLGSLHTNIPVVSDFSLTQRSLWTMAHAGAERYAGPPDDGPVHTSTQGVEATSRRFLLVEVTAPSLLLCLCSGLISPYNTSPSKTKPCC